ncbi:hypothetical protein ACOMCU_12445 [Lysinibacillus sp. UGB7]|uniref:hypothetical protein n=1 Tax=Lysinibacillus sp. UGB7 TaxID=3411039 RepID=UPI003B7DFD77
MSYFYDVQYFLDSGSIGIILELLLVTASISTVSYLSSAPILYILSAFFHYSTHLVLLVLAMTIQALILIIIKYQRNKQLNVHERSV